MKTPSFRFFGLVLVFVCTYCTMVCSTVYAQNAVLYEQDFEQTQGLPPGWSTSNTLPNPENV